MRTLAAGISRFRDTPLALVPITAEGVLGALLIALGIFPASGASAIVGAAFPLNVFFDLKQALAQTSGWFVWMAAMAVSVALRSASLAATIAAADADAGGFLPIWRRTTRLALTASVVLFPSAVLMFSGTASRYAPFLWTAALLGLFPALWLVRRAVSVATVVDAGDRSTIPEASSLLAYAYTVALFGAAMSSFGEISRFVSAAIVVFTAPIHALVFLGWREHARRGAYGGGGAVAVALTVTAIAILLTGTVYDRYIRNFPPVGRTAARGTLLLLGGVDATPRTGALADANVRRFGYSRENARHLSYVGDGRTMTKADTHGDLYEVAEVVAEQVADADEPVALLGHSQAGLILDRMIDEGLTLPSRSVILAPPPPFPPSLHIPPPDEQGPGKPGGDLARAFAAALDSVGLETYEVDTDAFPTNLEPLVLIDSQIRRASVWALGDSVWLDRDWRRPGEVNVVALTDHAGVVKNGRAVTTARRFFEGEPIERDEASWRGAFVSVLRHAFAPWRPQS